MNYIPNANLSNQTKPKKNIYNIKCTRQETNTLYLYIGGRIPPRIEWTLEIGLFLDCKEQHRSMNAGRLKRNLGDSRDCDNFPID